MKLDVFGLFSVEVLYVVIGIIAMLIVSIILGIIGIVKVAKLKKRYNQFMEGSDGKTIEKLIKDNLEDIGDLKNVTKKNTVAIKDIYDKMQYTFQKVGVVTYDAFHEMGGKLSFAICMLDKNNNGYIVNVMHSNTGCFAYVKEIVSGKSFLELGDEEQEALNHAVAGKIGDAELSREINEKINADKM